MAEKEEQSSLESEALRVDLNECEPEVMALSSKLASKGIQMALFAVRSKDGIYVGTVHQSDAQEVLRRWLAAHTN